MITQLNFDRESEGVEALLIYNFQSVRDLIEVRLISPSLTTDIFFYEELPNQWVTTDAVAENIPISFPSVIRLLETFFIQYHYSFRAKTSRHPMRVEERDYSAEDHNQAL